MKRKLEVLLIGALFACLMTNGYAQRVTDVTRFDKTRMIPTPKNFGKPIVAPNLSGLRKGILQCDVTGSGCMVMNMPLLYQEDARIDKDLQYISPTGCYLASMATVITAALANRNPSLAFGGRAKTFDSFTGDAAKSKELKQLNYTYRIFKDYEDGKTENGKLVQVLHFPEIVADFNKGKILQPCDPYVYGGCDKIGNTAQATNAFGDAGRMWMKNSGINLTNEDVIKLMEQGYVVMLAYMRYKPLLEFGPTPGPKIAPDQKKPVYLVFDTYHKVVVSGFRKGEKYPLIINDVGNGQRYNVRIGSDLVNRIFQASNHKTPFSQATFAFMPNEDPQTKIFVEYEGEGKGINDKIFFLQHYDYLRIKQ